MKIARDKWRHFFTGIPMGIVLVFTAKYITSGNLAATLTLAFVAVIAISYGFELFSKITGKGHHEIADALASIVGGSIGIAVCVPFLL